MKKIYIRPAVEIVSLQTVRMIAQSTTTTLVDESASEVARGRSNSLWDDEDE